MNLLSVDAALARVLALAEPLPIEQAPLVEAAGRVLAEDIVARRTQPASNLSAMDGYAIHFADLPGPWTVIGESAAGHELDRAVEEGEAARIFTGAPLPGGADTVLIQENAGRDGNRLTMTGAQPSHRGVHVRPRGVEFAEGDLLARSGDIATPQRIALLAAGGFGTLPVRRRARVLLVSTGDELVPPGAPTSGAQLPSSNAPMLAARLTRWPASIADAGIVRDDPGALAEAFGTAIDADLVLTTGGVSVGDHDHVQAALVAAGARLDFWRVALKPGKPLLAGKLGRAVVLGLPGNPVSALVTAILFAEPLLAKLSGSMHLLPRIASAPLAMALLPTGDRADYLRGRLIADGLTVAPRQDSGGLAALAQADVLVVRPPHSPPATRGELANYLSIA